MGDRSGAVFFDCQHGIGFVIFLGFLAPYTHDFLIQLVRSIADEAAFLLRIVKAVIRQLLHILAIGIQVSPGNEAFRNFVHRRAGKIQQHVLSRFQAVGFRGDEAHFFLNHLGHLAFVQR